MADPKEMTDAELIQQSLKTGANSNIAIGGRTSRRRNKGKSQNSEKLINEPEDLELRTFDPSIILIEETGPRKKYFSQEDTLKHQSNSSDAAAPLNMVELFSNFYHCLLTAYHDEPDGKLVSYLTHLYAQVISNGKDFKNTVKEVDEVDPEDMTTWGTAVHNKGRIICFVFKGTTGAKNLRSFVDEESRICCVSIKVFSAFVSLACVCTSKFPLEQLPMAPLGANIIKTYKKEKARTQRWDLHFHTGFNFVASMKVQSVERMTIFKSKKGEINKNVHTIISKVIELVPDLAIFVMVAFRMDSTRLDRDVAIVGKNQSLKTLIQSTGLTLSLLSNLVDRINLNDWDESFKGDSEALAETVFKMLEQKIGLKKKKMTQTLSQTQGKASSSKVSKMKKPVEDEEEEEEEDDDYDLSGMKEISIA